jgi:hypothetical protein
VAHDAGERPVVLGQREHRLDAAALGAEVGGVMPKPKEVCCYCEKKRTCDFNVWMGKSAYPICRLCIVEAKKDSFPWAKRK